MCGGKDTPIDENVYNMQTILQLSAGYEKSIPDLRIYIFIVHGRLDSILDSYSIPGIKFFSP
jgi:hypothetical protein